MSEHLALWSLKYFGPRAATATDKRRSADPEAPVEELERKAIEHQTRVSMTEGAFVGGPFIVLIPIAFCAALLAQAQMAFEVAAINGYAPTDQMRAADLLVLQGAYGTTEEAGTALNALTQAPRPDEHKRLPRGTRWNMIKRMAYLLGVIGASEDPKPSTFVRTLRWIWLGVTLVFGLVLPLLWVPYMAVAMRRSALQMGKKATAFYAERTSEEAGVTVARAPAPEIRIGLSAGLVRMVLLIAIPIVVAVVALPDRNRGRLRQVADRVLRTAPLLGAPDARLDRLPLASPPAPREGCKPRAGARLRSRWRPSRARGRRGAARRRPRPARPSSPRTRPSCAATA